MQHEKSQKRTCLDHSNHCEAHNEVKQRSNLILLSACPAIGELKTMSAGVVYRCPLGMTKGACQRLMSHSSQDKSKGRAVVVMFGRLPIVRHCEARNEVKQRSNLIQVKVNLQQLPTNHNQ
jgi:hypothetical protein